MRKKDGVSADVSETDKVVVLDMTAGLVVILERDDLPVVVGIIVRVTCNLLSLAGNATVVVTERVAVRMRVEVGLGFLVSDRNRVVVVNGDGIGEHDVVAQSLLELGSHKVISGTRSGQDGEMDLEPEEVEEEGHDDQTKGPSTKVLDEQAHRKSATRPLDIQEIPQVDDDGGADGDKGESADILGGDVAGQRKTGENKPLPPLAREGLVPQLVEPNIEQQAARHGEDEGGIEKDQSRLAYVGIVEEDETSGKETGRQAVARLPHDQIDNRDGQGAQDGG